MYGNAPSHLLFDKVDINKNEQVESPRSVKDYHVEVNKDLPEGVNLYEILSF